MSILGLITIIDSLKIDLRSEYKDDFEKSGFEIDGVNYPRAVENHVIDESEDGEDRIMSRRFEAIKKTSTTSA